MPERAEVEVAMSVDICEMTLVNENQERAENVG